MSSGFGKMEKLCYLFKVVTIERLIKELFIF